MAFPVVQQISWTSDNVPGVIDYYEVYINGALEGAPDVEYLDVVFASPGIYEIEVRALNATEASDPEVCRYQFYASGLRRRLSDQF